MGRWIQVASGESAVEGEIVGLSAWPLIDLGRLLEKVDPKQTTFAILPRLADYEAYSDEALLIAGEDRDLLELEIEAVRDLVSGAPAAEWTLMQGWRDHLACAGEDLRTGLDATLVDGLGLCEASRSSGFPIRALL